MRRWLAARLVLLALHATYVLVQLGAAPRALVVGVIVVLATLAAVLGARDEARLRGVFAAAALVLAALHARVVPGDAPWLALQLGLAAAIAASAAATLLGERAGTRRPGLVGLVVGTLVAMAIVAPAVALHGAVLVAPALGLVAFALARPLGALGAVLAEAGWHDAPRDPMLWWRAELASRPAWSEVLR